VGQDFFGSVNFFFSKKKKKLRLSGTDFQVLWESQLAGVYCTYFEPFWWWRLYLLLCDIWMGKWTSSWNSLRQSAMKHVHPFSGPDVLSLPANLEKRKDFNANQERNDNDIYNNTGW